MRAHIQREREKTKDVLKEKKGATPEVPILFSALLQCLATSRMPKTENLSSLASVRPRHLRLVLVHSP